MFNINCNVFLLWLMWLFIIVWTGQFLSPVISLSVVGLIDHHLSMDGQVSGYYELIIILPEHMNSLSFSSFPSAGLLILSLIASLQCYQPLHSHQERQLQMYSDFNLSRTICAYHAYYWVLIENFNQTFPHCLIMSNFFFYAHRASVCCTVVFVSYGCSETICLEWTSCLPHRLLSI